MKTTKQPVLQCGCVYLIYAIIIVPVAWNPGGYFAMGNVAYEPRERRVLAMRFFARLKKICARSCTDGAAQRGATPPSLTLCSLPTKVSGLPFLC